VINTLPFGTLPRHWKVERLDRLFRIVKEDAHPEDEPVSAFIDGVVTLRANRPEAVIKGSGQEIGYKHLEKNDLVISGMNAHLGGLGISDSPGKCTPVYTILRKTREIHEHYISYYLWHAARSGYIKSLVNAVRYNSADFGPETIKNFMVPVPPIDEQREIADYLDGQVSVINKAVELKKALRNAKSEAYNSQRHQLVTGFGAESSLKSDLDWIPVPPPSWEKVPLRALFSWHKGKDPARLDHVYCATNPGEFPVFSGQTGNDGIFGLINTFDFSFQDQCALVSTVGAQTGTMRIVSGKFSLSQNCALVIPRSPRCSIAYLYFLWPSIWSSMKSQIPSDMQPSLRLSDLSDVWLYLPPTNEQERIVNALKVQEEDLLAILTALDESIIKLEELKTGLIAAAVTGVEEVFIGRDIA
jgi:type I restriction enzyme S subunit